MLNVKRALFQVMVAKYFSSCIPVIGETEEGRGGCFEDSDYTDSNTQGAFGRSASDGVDDVTAQNSTVALQMQHHGETKAVSQPGDRKQQRPRGVFFLRRVVITEVKHQSLHNMQNRASGCIHA